MSFDKRFSNAVGGFINSITGRKQALDQEQKFNSAEAEMQRSFSAIEAQKQRNWEEYMSNTAYQRQMADMKAAGINPALAFGNGGAEVPSGATAQGVSAHSGSGSSGGLGEIASVFNSASNMMRASNNEYDDRKIVNTAIKVVKLLK